MLFFQDFNSESQQIELELAYPRRNVTVLGSYNVSSKSLASDLSLTWDKWTQLKTVEAALDWTKVSSYPNHHQALFELRHPSFEKVKTKLYTIDIIESKKFVLSSFRIIFSIHF